MEFPELEPYFQAITDITDNIASINTHYDVDHEKDFSELEKIAVDVFSRSWEKTDENYFKLFTSYYTFHIKIIEELISEARRILNPEKREYLKRLVAYKKSSDEWFAALKKKRKLAAVA
ncbi:MAG TPA: PLU-1-like domain protein [Leptospiraceae bacterium]|nr:PLU-1-like domain protein [Leptospiraceae bacterium]HMY67850.1 PLU-1-like domain protein [Leptospiraceae bacterium]HMZ60410.1 PLU-1-like domain protein [Leptospiraceae bacterium]HNF15608.1 PLU-1-like domain protein [Leptospiraceae bacterium]HNF27779.1 PLU-1-like domain protein [Leptospiraceae bacterium]